MPSENFCLRCQSLELEVLPVSSKEITFYRCPQCGREFAQQPGLSLTERWRGALSLVLYGTIFSRHPQDDAQRIADRFRRESTPQQIEWIVREIREELVHPTQRVQHIHDQPQSEEDLRELLRNGCRPVEPVSRIERKGSRQHGTFRPGRGSIS